MHRLAPLLSAPLFALTLAGCATQTVPAALPERGERYEFASAITPHRLASCAALNARIFSGGYASDVDELVRPDNYQVVVRPIGSWTGQPIIVARTAPVPGGSQMVLHLSAALTSTERADWIARMRNGCEIDIRTAGVVPMGPRDALPAVNPPPPAPASPPPAGRQPRG